MGLLTSISAPVRESLPRRNHRGPGLRRLRPNTQPYCQSRDCAICAYKRPDPRLTPGQDRPAEKEEGLTKKRPWDELVSNQASPPAKLVKVPAWAAFITARNGATPREYLTIYYLRGTAQLKRLTLAWRRKYNIVNPWSPAPRT